MNNTQENINPELPENYINPEILFSKAVPQKTLPRHPRATCTTERRESGCLSGKEFAFNDDPCST